LAVSNTPDARTFRHKTNRIAALALQVLMAGLWILNDPLLLRGPLPRAEALPTPAAVAVPAIMGVVGVVVMAYAWYSRVDVTDDEVVIRNPLKDIRIHGGVDDVDLNSRHVRIRVAGKWYRCWGAETSLAMQLWQKRSSSSAKLAGAIVLHRRPADRPPEKVWRRPTRLEVVVLLFWTGLVVFSAIHGVGRTS
jgi:hypothetical protein